MKEDTFRNTEFPIGEENGLIGGRCWLGTQDHFRCQESSGNWKGHNDFYHRTKDAVTGCGAERSNIASHFKSEDWRLGWTIVRNGEYIYLNWLPPGLICGMQDLQLWHVGSSSLTRDRTWAPCIGSIEFLPLDHQGNPLVNMFCSWKLWTDLPTMIPNAIMLTHRVTLWSSPVCGHGLPTFFPPSTLVPFHPYFFLKPLSMTMLFSSFMIFYYFILNLFKHFKFLAK